MSEKKTSYLYVFSTPKSSKEFLDFAMAQTSCAFAQHPQRNGIPNELKVLVTSTDSTIFALWLKESLDKKAKQLGGEFQPRV